jgi:hypothetical protein
VGGLEWRWCVLSELKHVGENRFKRELEDFLSYVDDLEFLLEEAVSHIKRHLDAYSPEELEEMAFEGLIDYEDIPEDKRTEWVRSRVGR